MAMLNNQRVSSMDIVLGGSTLVPYLHPDVTKQAPPTDCASLRARLGDWHCLGAGVGPSPVGGRMGSHQDLYSIHMAVCQNLVPLVNVKIAGIYGCSSL